MWATKEKMKNYENFGKDDGMHRSRQFVSDVADAPIAEAVIAVCQIEEEEKIFRSQAVLNAQYSHTPILAQDRPRNKT